MAMISGLSYVVPVALGPMHISPVYGAIVGNVLLGLGILILVRHDASPAGTVIISLLAQETLGWRAGCPVRHRSGHHHHGPCLRAATHSAAVGLGRLWSASFSRRITARAATWRARTVNDRRRRAPPDYAACHTAATTMSKDARHAIDSILSN